MHYQEVKKSLEEIKLNLENKMHDTTLSPFEKEEIKRSIENYEYILELTDMNHFDRGSIND